MNEWYQKLKKAPWNPPSYVFGVVWTILYILMAISAYLIFINKKCNPFCYALTIFFVQLLINLSWTTIFFNLRMIKFALFVLVLIFALVIYTYVLFNKIDKIASYLLIPYILWLLVALSLNIYIVIYNEL
jgi:translocator protein